MGILDMNETVDIKMNILNSYSFTHEIYNLAPLPTNEVLSNEEYGGMHEFEVSMLPNDKSKNPWVYSPVLNKVFMDMGQQFPVDFKIKNRPIDKQLFVRITPQYSAHNFAGDAVFRCIQHDHPGDPTNKDIEEHVRQHVIRCTNKLSQYIGDTKQNQRLSIVFPLSIPQVGNESVRELFYFVCKNSCPLPGMNRRGIEVIFTLEDTQGSVLGRKSLNVRVCACPKRDKEKEESEASKNSGNAPRGKKRKAQHPPSVNPALSQNQTDDFKIYTLNLQFCGRQNLLDVLKYAEEKYMSRCYQAQGSPEVAFYKKTLQDILEAKRQILQQ